MGAFSLIVVINLLNRSTMTDIASSDSSSAVTVSSEEVLSSIKTPVNGTMADENKNEVSHELNGHATKEDLENGDSEKKADVEDKIEADNTVNDKAEAEQVVETTGPLTEEKEGELAEEEEPMETEPVITSPDTAQEEDGKEEVIEDAKDDLAAKTEEAESSEKVAEEATTEDGADAEEQEVKDEEKEEI